MIIGIPLGILIGTISGAVALVLIRTANSIRASNLKPIVAVTAEILAIPTFWFGGSWVTTKFISVSSIPDILNAYIVTLAITFSIFIFYPITRWIIKIGHELGREVDTDA